MVPLEQFCYHLIDPDRINGELSQQMVDAQAFLGGGASLNRDVGRVKLEIMVDSHNNAEKVYRRLFSQLKDLIARQATIDGNVFMGTNPVELSLSRIDDVKQQTARAFSDVTSTNSTLPRRLQERHNADSI